MAHRRFKTRTIDKSNVQLGGLNDGFNPLSVKDNQSSGLQNIDFSLYSAIRKRNGYAALNTTAITGEPALSGLHWFEYISGGNRVGSAVAVAGTDIYKMDDLDGTWDTITNAQTISASGFCDFETFNGSLYLTDGVNAPLYVPVGWATTTAAVPTNLTSAKYLEQFNNYLFYLNVVVSGTRYNSRIYHSAIGDPTSFDALDYYDISKNDGDEIVGSGVIGNRMAIFKNRSIYNLFFTGDADIPFSYQKSQSHVGCCSNKSIQLVDNGLMFASWDGVYFYDGTSSKKVSDDINTSFSGLATASMSKCVAVHYQKKGQYWLFVPPSGGSTNTKVFVFNYLINQWSVYTNMSCAYAAIFNVSDNDERVYFGDYAGFVYQADTGYDDYPLNVQTAINAYYWTNWKYDESIAVAKSIPHVYVVHRIESSTVTFAYSYDLQSGSQYSNSLDMSFIGTSARYGTAVYDTDVYAAEGHAVQRVDLVGSGRFRRYCISNNAIGQSFEILGIGEAVVGETLA